MQQQSWTRQGQIFFRLPAIVEREGEKTQELSTKRRVSLLSAIRRSDLIPEKYPYTRVCSDHFVKAKPSSLYDTDDPDWAPTLKLGCGSKGAPMSSSSRHARFVEQEAKIRKLECVEVEKCVELQESQGNKLTL